MPRREHVEPTVMIGLTMDRAVLDERIKTRTRRMWRDGLVEEVRHLEGVGLRHGRTASTAIGYSQALAQLDGRLTEAEAIEQTTAATRRLVRRQESWFRADPRIIWLDATAPDLLPRARQVLRTHAVGVDARGADAADGIPDNGRHDR